MNRTTIKDFIAENDRLSTDDCKKCGKKVELIFENYSTSIDGILIDISDLPQLKCTVCGEKILSSKSKQVVFYLYNECIANNQKGVSVTPKNLKKKYNFCTSYNFNYDYRDYENIPGLVGLTEDGFLTPVFFKKEALIYFMHHPEYELNLFSESYGVFGYGDKFQIPFGLNRNDKLIIWLGDLDNLDAATLKYLEIHNVPSDHTLMDTEFFDAQLNVIWSEPIIERQIVNLRNKFYDLLKSKHGVDIHHLDNEVIKALENINKPITFSESEIAPVISALHKILIEAVKKDALKQYYESNVTQKDKNYKNWGSIKYYDYLLSNFSTKNVRDLISPLYILNDLRIIFFHLLSSEEEEKLKQNIVSSFNLTVFDVKTIYLVLVEKLKELYEELNAVI
ncbi:YgiT-type zinc finger protein [Paenibacillus illinoisensis]|uniref:YgiT-type zinc finger protein n=1 Tax=Paenibacillus illinoisensis TaxID=59845 RepID=UPI003D27116C